MTVIQELTEAVVRFRDERDWGRFHSPKNLAGSICIEAAELLEVLQWVEGEDARDAARARVDRIAAEAADVGIYLLLLCREVGIDLEDAVRRKLRENAEKYPVEKARGKAAKYTEL